MQTSSKNLVGFSRRAPAAEVVKQMRARRFDFAPVVAGDVIVGRIALSDLETLSGSISRSVEPLTAKFMISADSSVRRLLRWLAEDPWLLVIDGNEISGVVTPSDLNRQGPRSHFYLLIAEFEIKLANAIRSRLPEDDSVSMLSLKDQKRIRKLQAEQSKGSIDTDAVALMTLSNLINIAKKSDIYRTEFACTSKSEWSSIAGRVNSVRHMVMHPTRPMLNDREGIERLIRTEDNLVRLISSEPPLDQRPSGRSN